MFLGKSSLVHGNSSERTVTVSNVNGHGGAEVAVSAVPVSPTTADSSRVVISIGFIYSNCVPKGVVQLVVILIKSGGIVIRLRRYTYMMV